MTHKNGSSESITAINPTHKSRFMIQSESIRIHKSSQIIIHHHHNHNQNPSESIRIHKYINHHQSSSIIPNRIPWRLRWTSKRRASGSWSVPSGWWSWAVADRATGGRPYLEPTAVVDVVEMDGKTMENPWQSDGCWANFWMNF